MSVTSISGARAQAIAPQDARLRKTAQQLEGLFVEQLFQAMRETVPEGGVLDGGAGEEMFRGMMDQHLAEQVPQGWERGLGAAIYRQLRGALGGAPEAAGASNEAGGSR